MRALKGFLAGIFSLIFGVLLIATICVFSISYFATKENIVKKIQEADLLTEVQKIRNSGSSDGSTGVTQVIEEMYSLASQFSVSEEDVDSIIDSDIVKEIIGYAVGNLTDYIINGTDTTVLSEDDIYNLISDNLDDILEENNISLDDGQKEKFLREIEKQLPDIVEAIPTSEDIVGSNYSDSIEQIQMIFSDTTKTALCVGLIISGVLIIILKWKNFEWVKYLGVTMLISGLITIGISLILPEIMVDMIGTTDLSLFATSLTDYLAEPILYSGIGVIVVAILLFIIRLIYVHKKGIRQ